MRTYNDIYIDASKRMKKAGIEAASLEARLLLAYAADKTPEELLRDIRLYPGDEIERKAELFFDRRLSGEPAAYILGEWEFCGLSFEVNPNVLIPRMDTELLPELLLKHIGGAEKPRILDLCAGSGCIGLTAAARKPDLTAVLADVDERALMVCRRNAMRHKLTARTLCVRADALDKPSVRLGSFDAIVCNPPYIATGEIEQLDISVKDHEPRSALDGGEDGLDFYRSICAFWSGLLRGGGILVFECGEGQSGTVTQIARGAGLEHIQSAADTLGVERAIVFRK